MIMSDSSLMCSRDTPECNRLELKSPILRGRLMDQRSSVVVAAPGCAAGVLGPPRDDDATAAAAKECGWLVDE